MSLENTAINQLYYAPADRTEKEIKKWTLDDKEINVINQNNKAQFMVTQYGRNTLIPAHGITGIPNGLNLAMLTAFLANTWVRLRPVGQGEYTLHINQRLQGGGNIIRNPHKLWPNGIIPYQIDEKIYRDDDIYSFEDKEKQIILSVIAEWNQADTGFQIVPHTDQANVLIFGEDPKACYSQVGCQGGEQYIRCRLETGAFNRAKILQEIAHAVGLYPEHNRFDRDHYISVPGSEHVDAYKKLPENHAVGLYDFASITHCAIKTADDDHEKVAINFASLGDWTKSVGKAERLSPGDITAAKQLYQTTLSIHVPSSNAVLSHIVDNREEKSAVVVLNENTSLLDLGHLQDLEIRSNGTQFTSLPVGLGQLTNLQRLAIEVDYLIALPAEIGQLNNLQSLSIYAKQLASIPTQLERLSNLQSLIIRADQLTSLPAAIGQLNNLQSLSIYAKQLASIPTQLERLSNLQSLLISADQLTSLHAEMGQLNNLQRLEMYAPQLTSIPASLGQLSNLQCLMIRAPSLPAEMGQLSNLQDLIIDADQLTSLPVELGQLSNLQRLIIEGNKLTSLPIELGQLSNLNHLAIYADQLTFLPAELRQLSHLRSLYIYADQLIFLPAELGQLSNLGILEINGRRLTSLTQINDFITQFNNIERK